MNRSPWSRRIASIIIVAIVAMQIGHLWLGSMTGSLTDQSGISNVLYIGITLAFSDLFAAVGWTIASRQPRNTIGWLLLAVPFLIATGFFVADYADLALVVHPGSLPFGRLAAWFDRWLIVLMFTSLIPIFQLFPDGRIPSRRWRPLLWLTVVGPTIAIVSFALTPGRMTGAFADLTTVRVINPLGIDGLKAPLYLLTVVGSVLTLLAAVLAGVAIVVRYRGASAEVRQQIRWLRFVGVAVLIELAANIILGVALGNSDAGWVGDLLFFSVFFTLMVGIPVACGIAILKYRLYDLDVVIRKTVVFALLAVFITVVYALIVGLGSQLFNSSALSFVAAAVLAVAFQPVRERTRKIADRIVYGQRSTPYEVLSEFSGRVGEAYATEDVLGRMAQVLAAGTGAESATVWLRSSGEMRPAASVPVENAPPSELPSDAVEVRHQGEVLGALSVEMPASDPMNPAKQKLVEDLASQAGLVLRNVRLIQELRASRQRLVAAQDEERRKIERNIHDGAQQQLVALSVQLKLARTMLDRDPAKAGDLLDTLRSTATEALEDLRDLARGIYPPLLADKGLVAALEAQARKAAVPVAVDADGIGRYPEETEAAVYFCVLEALNNVAKYADASHTSVSLARSDSLLIFTVADDGKGFDTETAGYGTGLQGMADRLEAIGGTLNVESQPGTGTSVIGTLTAGDAS